MDDGSGDEERLGLVMTVSAHPSTQMTIRATTSGVTFGPTTSIVAGR
ncbi:MAG: hypothetical protein ACXVJZ_10595 [Acidimicrobiia bacterium]